MEIVQIRINMSGMTTQYILYLHLYHIVENHTEGLIKKNQNLHSHVPLIQIFVHI